MCPVRSAWFNKLLLWARTVPGPHLISSHMWHACSGKMTNSPLNNLESYTLTRGRPTQIWNRKERPRVPVHLMEEGNWQSLHPRGSQPGREASWTGLSTKEESWHWAGRDAAALCTGGVTAAGSFQMAAVWPPTPPGLISLLKASLKEFQQKFQMRLLVTQAGSFCFPLWLRQ